MDRSIHDTAKGPRLEYCLCRRAPARIERINMVDPETVKTFLAEHKDTSYTLYVRRRDPNGRRGQSWPCGQVNGAKEFEALLNLPRVQESCKFVLTAFGDPAPSSCEIPKENPIGTVSRNRKAKKVKLKALRKARRVTNSRID